ncbi:ORF1117 [White spot syndrome virus]|uniref:Wsv160 n=3 Tax=White spot syndrome virus TaxID=342409 RepID=Q8VB37_WSSVS|nr:wsv160 [Shrimp white spot syndrome virus]ATU84037.1 ORF1117 [White spot syndrome virus]AAL33164.1 wsv160 [Shrimp white spot syndrome virus]AAL89084.1 WSSV216 [Shrimp white spot syndrome virus]AWQ60342.1 wsv160 [Shrimp white spot syndrome virus]AWQ60755.1 wsv160 [Shrimp white spot syndrome virus]
MGMNHMNLNKTQHVKHIIFIGKNKGIHLMLLCFLCQRFLVLSSNVFHGINFLNHYMHKVLDCSSISIS